jgi:hypothetical protein
MSQIVAAGPDHAAMLRAYEARLEHALPFREDAQLLRELGAERLAASSTRYMALSLA